MRVPRGRTIFKHQTSQTSGRILSQNFSMAVFKDLFSVNKQESVYFAKIGTAEVTICSTSSVI